MKKYFTFIVLAVIFGILAYKSFVGGWDCGPSCEPYGFCRCYGLPLGDSECLGVKKYLNECCIECVMEGSELERLDKLN